MKKNKLTKKVWYGDQLWEITKTLEPSVEDQYLLVQRKNPNASTDMYLIDVGNESFYPDTPRVQKLIAKKLKHEEAIKKIVGELDSFWLDVALDEYY